MKYVFLFSGIEAIGNSMAVPVMKWIGERIDLADKEELRNGD